MASLYLSPESRVTLSLIDAGLDLPEAQRDLAGHSVFELSTGALLIMRAEGRRSFEVLVPSGSAALVGSNAGALGVEIASLAVTLDCLLGECEVRAGETSRTLLQAGSRVSIREGELSAEVIISAESLERWNQLCNACLANTSYLPLLVKRLRP
jgi:ferric-dicitrate binding protein FerR (iron transport regulator)